MRSLERTVFLAFSLMAAAFILPCPEAVAFRCGDGVVGVGDTKSRVLVECGKPTYRDRVGSKEVRTGEQSPKQKRVKRSKTVEQWSYNCGDGDFIYVLTFEGGKLVHEETNGRGKGRSRCGGAR